MNTGPLQDIKFNRSLRDLRWLVFGRDGKFKVNRTEVLGDTKAMVKLLEKTANEIVTVGTQSLCQKKITKNIL